MSGQLVKHMSKVALLTLAASVLLLETIGPQFGIHGFVGPLVTQWLEEQQVTGSAARNTDVVRTQPTQVEEIPATIKPGSPEAVAMEGCAAAINAVSLHPQFNRIPFVAPVRQAQNIVYEWTAENPLVAMAVDGSEVQRAVYCEVLSTGEITQLIFDGRTLANDGQGRSSITKDWQVIRAVSRIDGSTNVSVVGHSLHPLSDGETLPQLYLHCGEDKTVAYLQAGVPLGAPQSQLAMTVVADGQESVSQWSVSEDGLNAFATGQYIPFIRELMRADIFLLRYTDAQGQVQESPFDPHGVTAAVAPLQEACHW